MILVLLPASFGDILPDPHDGESLLGPLVGIAAPVDGQGPQGQVLLHEVVSQLKGDRISQTEAAAFQKALVNHADGLTRVLRAQEAALGELHLATRRPADGGHIVGIHHIESMEIVVRYLDKLPQGGEVLGFQPVLRQIGHIRDIGPPVFAAVVPNIKGKVFLACADAPRRTDHEDIAPVLFQGPHRFPGDVEIQTVDDV